MLQAWLTCPKAFYDRYILGKIDTEQSASLHFGTAVHLGVRTALEGENGVEAFKMYWDSIKTVHMRYYDQSWGDLRDLGEHFITNFKARHAKKFSDFTQELQMEMPFLGEHTLQGTADLIGMYEGKLSVCDWKTSSKAYRKNKILLNFQMYIYAKLYQHNFNRLPEQLVYKVFNKNDGNINTIVQPLTQQYLDAIVIDIEHATRGMLHAIETKQLWHGADCFCERL
jgi:hypothetical protein